MRIDSGYASSSYALSRPQRVVTPVGETTVAGDAGRQGTSDSPATVAQRSAAALQRVTASTASRTSDAGDNGLVLSEREGRFAGVLSAHVRLALASYDSTAALGYEQDGADSVVGLDLYA